MSLKKEKDDAYSHTKSVCLPNSIFFSSSKQESEQGDIIEIPRIGITSSCLRSPGDRLTSDNERDFMRDRL